MCEEILLSQIPLPSQQSSPTMLLTNSRWLLKAPTFKNCTSHLIFRQRIVRTRILRSRGSKMKQTNFLLNHSFLHLWLSFRQLLIDRRREIEERTLASSERGLGLLYESEKVTSSRRHRVGLYVLPLDLRLEWQQRTSCQGRRSS